MELLKEKLEPHISVFALVEIVANYVFTPVALVPVAPAEDLEVRVRRSENDFASSHSEDRARWWGHKFATVKTVVGTLDHYLSSDTLLCAVQSVRPIDLGQGLFGCILTTTVIKTWVAGLSVNMQDFVLRLPEGTVVYWACHEPYSIICRLRYSMPFVAPVEISFKEAQIE